MIVIMGSGKGKSKRTQAQTPQALGTRLGKKTFFVDDGKKFVVFGAGLVDDNTIEQMKRAMNLAVVRQGSLQADGHYGYGLSIGGVIGLDNAVSPAAVGYDQACLVANTPVVTEDGYWLPIEEVRSEHNVLCWDGEKTRRITPLIGSVAKGKKMTQVITLTDGRTIQATSDHLLRTKDGWKEVNNLQAGDQVAVSTYIGLPYKRVSGALDMPAPITHSGPGKRQNRAEGLAKRGLWPVRSEDPRFPALLRILAYCCGDGHLHVSGQTAALYTSVYQDALDLAHDIEQIGFRAVIDVRDRGGNIKRQYVVRSNSVELHALLEAMGCPVGNKVYSWPEYPMPWLDALPAWTRGLFLSSFLSAEAQTPCSLPGGGYITPMLVKQTGTTPNAINFIARLFESLGYQVRIAPSGPAAPDGRQSWALQLLGGETEQLKLISEVGFVRASEKRIASAAMISAYWQREAVRAHRREAIKEAKAAVRQIPAKIIGMKTMARKYPVAENSFSRVLLGEAGQLAISRVAAALRSEGFDGVEDWSEQLKTEKTFPTRKSIARSIAGKYKVPYALVLHGIYGRGDPRVPKHITYHPNSSNEVSWLPIISIEKGLKKDVYDVVTGDNASCFFANGILAHNCGVRAAKLDVKFADIEPDLKTYLHAMKRRIPIGLGKQHEKPVEHEIFDRDEWSEAPLNSIVGRDGQTLKEIAQLQIGSAGSGNHFYEILEDENGDAWTLIHFGSRSPGYKTAEYFIKLAEKENPTETGLSWLSMDGDAGQTYWHVHQLARDFAYAGRNMVGEAMRDVLGARELQVVHNHHNFAGVEEHQGEKLYVHRKGATPAGLGEAGIIPGSMGDSSYIVEGLGNEESLRSSSHGAGRVMSRTAAHGKRDKRTGEWKTRPRVTEGAMKAWLKKEGVVLLGGDLDESPHVYKRINEVMAAQTELVRPITKLRPRGVIMSPPDPRKAKMRMRTKPIDDA